MLILLRNILKEYVKLNPIILIKINETLRLVGIGDWATGIGNPLFVYFMSDAPSLFPNAYLRSRIQSIANQ
jgi:hypothetical protein